MINQEHLDYLRQLDLQEMTELAEGVLIRKDWPVVSVSGEDQDDLDSLALILFCAETLDKHGKNEVLLRLVAATVGRLDARLSIVRTILLSGISDLSTISSQTEYGAGYVSGMHDQSVEIARELGMHTLIQESLEYGKAEVKASPP